MKNNSIVYELKGEEVVCPTIINLSLDDVMEFRAYFEENSNVNDEDLIFNKTVVHLKNGAMIRFNSWQNDDTIFINEPIKGFSGPNKAKIKVIFTKRALL